ncbi:MAG: alpha-glucan family phosphorylase, partial [Alistipes sp.]|nr:alpha-glucan family phosphorylase [Alistipes sp.]
GAGWMLPMERTYADQGYQNELDAEMIYNTIEDQIVPLYYDRSEDGVPHRWCDAIKKCVADIASNFTTNRMLIDYEERFYNKLAARKTQVVDNNYRLAREIAAWKRKVSAAWDDVKILNVQRVELNNEAIFVDKKYRYEVTLDMANLTAEDLGVEVVVAKQIESGEAVNVVATKALEVKSVNGSEITFSIDYTPARTGTFDVALRVYPKNDRLPYRMDFALVKWA